MSDTFKKLCVPSMRRFKLTEALIIQKKLNAWLFSSSLLTNDNDLCKFEVSHSWCVNFLNVSLIFQEIYMC